MKAEKISELEFLDKMSTPRRGIGARREDVKTMLNMEFGEAMRFTYDSIQEMRKAASAISPMVARKNSKSGYDMYEYLTVKSENSIYVKKNKKQEEM